MNVFLAVIHEHRESVLALRIFFSILLTIVFLSGFTSSAFANGSSIATPSVAADHYGARNLRLWQVILVWLLAMDLLITALFYL